MEKVEKLLQLAKGSSGGEAETATLKARELIRKNHLHHLGDWEGEGEGEGEENDELVEASVREQKRSNQKMRSIAHILDEFMVYSYFSYIKSGVRHMIMGSAPRWRWPCTWGASCTGNSKDFGKRPAGNGDSVAKLKKIFF